jgi:hypothetical protein
MKKQDDDGGHCDGLWRDINELIHFQNSKTDIDPKTDSPFYTFGIYRRLPGNKLWGNRNNSDPNCGSFEINVSHQK